MAKQRISTFFNNEIEAILNKYKQIEALIPKQQIKKDGELAAGSDHTAEEGRFIESILRSTLNKYLPKNLKALSGFILRPEAMVGENDNSRIIENEGDQHSRQLDIIIFDVGNYPVYEQFEEFAIVPPEGIIAVISVKKTLRKADINHELDCLADAASLSRHYIRKQNTELATKSAFEKINVVAPATILVGFTSDFGAADSLTIANDVFNSCIEPLKKYPYDAIVKLITVLDKLSILKTEEQSSNIKSDGIETTFVWYKHTHEDEKYYDVGIQLILQSILKVYYQRTRSPFIVKPGFEKIEDVFKVKDRLGFLKSSGYRIENTINTGINAKRKLIRQQLLSGKKDE
ncbi:hypothetical protein EZL74_08515 [Flavobacterium silvisoli]|uniref:DUF6602 domain-containing protein n=1 Tax=Flavobacterium silvisoli TaxID=2529433 RepID=A0A4Q9YXC7_9FLAO|nr:DUF6602 domain-containing protein [Flavobacterium silvisoli]TBX68344.1 hypothetical protein EZL74_08515 [Flavobacterium silvisoli]